MSLRRLVILGVGWTASSAVIIQALTLLRITLVARWLGPEYVGLYGLAMATMAAITLMRQFGFKQAFISLSPSSGSDLDDWLHSMWALNVLFGIVVTAITVLAAYPASLFLDEERLMPILLVVSLLPMIGGLLSPGLMLLEKRAEFQRIATYELLKAAFQTVVVLALVWQVRSVWALVYGNLAAELAGVLISYLIVRQRPKLMFHRRVLSQALSFGKHIFVIAVLTYVTNQVDDVVVGAWLGVEALGYYLLAYRLAMFPVWLLASIVSRVMLPVYRMAIDDSKDRLRVAWLKVFPLIPWALFALLLPIGLYADELIALLLGEQWRAAATVATLLTVAAAFCGLVHSITPIMFVLKQPAADARYKLIEAVVFVPSLFVGVHLMGLHGAALAAIASYAIAFLLRVLWLSRSLDVSMLVVGQALLWPGSAAGIMIVAWWFEVGIIRSPVVGTGVFIFVCAAALVLLMSRMGWKRGLDEQRHQSDE